MFADIKFDSKVLEDVKKALAPYTADMFRDRAGRWMAIVELAHVERVEPGPDEEKAPVVKVRIVGIEVAADEVGDERLRQQQSLMYERRTSGGTLFEGARTA